MERLLSPFSFLLSALTVVACGAAGGGDPGAPEETPPEASAVGVTRQPLSSCQTDGDCDDGLYCNGKETCLVLPTVVVSGLTVQIVNKGTCVAGTAVTCNDGVACTVDRCSEARRACQFTAPDADGDGHYDAQCTDKSGKVIGDDCDDHDGQRFPGNAETCDKHDEDCNPSTYGFRDADGDGSVSNQCCNGTLCGPDCNDARSDVHPINVDPCDGVDNDCDGQIDENCKTVECAGEVALYPDADGDGWGATGSSPVNACSGAQKLAPNAGDCDDTNPAIRPGAIVCTAAGATVCQKSGQYQAATCPGVLPRCVPQPNGTGVCYSVL